MLYKNCTNCKTVKPLPEFNLDAVQADGYQVWCASCTAVYDREQRAAYGRLNDARRQLNAELTGEKTCTRCGVTKDLQAGFARDRTRADGRQDRCRDCDRLAHQARWAGYRARNLALRAITQ